MARIQTYISDSLISAQDKLIGTDAVQSQTKNYTFEAIGDYINNSNVVSILGQNNYKFQESASDESTRSLGTVSFLTYGGGGTNFSDVTSLVFSGQNSGGISSSEFLNTFVRKDVFITQLDNYDNFGIYKLNSLTELPSEPGFFQASLTHVDSNGSFVTDKHYGLALYQSAGGGLTGTVQTFDMESEDGSLFTIAITNAGVLIAIPEGSTEPVITSPPVITGTEKVWYTLGSIAGSVTGSPTPERTFQWQRSPTGLNWTDITGATSATYTLVDADAGQRIRVVQTETNVLDSVSAFSDPTQAIEASIFKDTQWQNITPITWGALTTQNWD